MRLSRRDTAHIWEVSLQHSGLGAELQHGGLCHLVAMRPGGALRCQLCGPLSTGHVRVQISFQEFKNRLLEKGQVAKIQITNRATAKVYVHADGASRLLREQDLGQQQAPGRVRRGISMTSGSPLCRRRRRERAEAAAARDGPQQQPHARPRRVQASHTVLWCRVFAPTAWHGAYVLAWALRPSTALGSDCG